MALLPKQPYKQMAVEHQNQRYKPDVAAQPLVLMLCTGNAARSPMATLIGKQRNSTYRFQGAGTHSIEGLAMSGRTRKALESIGLSDASHRSHQLSAADTRDASLIVAFAPEHVDFVRRTYPEAAAKTATIHHLIDHLRFSSEPLEQRVAALHLAEVKVPRDIEVTDPGGGDDNAFIACLREIDMLMQKLLALL